MTERSAIEAFRESFPAIRAYDEAVETLVGKFCGELGMRLGWRANGPLPPEWLERDGKALYEGWSTVLVLSPIFCLTPKDKPAAGRWMVHLWHDVPYQRLDARVLCLVGGNAESWENVWRQVQIEGHRGRRLGAGRRAWQMAFEDFSCAWEDEIVELESLGSEAAFQDTATRMRALVAGLLAGATAAEGPESGAP